MPHVSCDNAKERVIVPYDHGTKGTFTNNSISTTKYSLWLFLPMNLWDQFQRTSNIYFLIISILQIFPFSPYAPTAWLPLVFVLAVNATKEAVEDYNRYRSDVRSNSCATTLIDGTESTWQHVHVGDTLLLKDGMKVPADVIIITTSDAVGGTCFIETAELDGETNLKNREAIEATHILNFGAVERSKHRDMIASNVERITVDLPNEKLEELRGEMKLKGSAETVPITNKNVVLRGCVVKNTDWMIGLVLYTGMQTKLLKNNTTESIVKHSSCERKTDKYTFGMFAFLIGLCVLGGILNGVYLMTEFDDPEPWYFHGDLEHPAEGTFIGILTFLVLLSQLIPISLSVTMEMVKVFHALLIRYDEEMKFNPRTQSSTEGKEEDYIYATPRTTNLSEDLGRIRYVFTDKTGTLTRNVMEFMKCTVKPGVMYGCGVTEIARTLAKKKGQCITEVTPPSGVVFERGNNFYDPKIYNGAWKSQNNAQDIEEFFRAIGVCHTVVAKTEDDGTMQYQASSPDEHALLMGAKGQGFVFKGRTHKDLVLEVMGIPETHTILDVNEFDSTRKRMSVVALDNRTGELYLYCKGADSAVFPKLASVEEWHEATRGMVAEFALDGLRTLCITRRRLSEAEYTAWNSKVVAVNQSKAEDMEDQIAVLADEIETNLELLGVTAVEDKLQEGVPACIHTMLRASIQVWVLTGDKVETAVNIAMACSLLDSSMNVYTIVGGEKDTIMNLIQASYAEASSNPSSENGVAIDGAALFHALEQEDAVGPKTNGDFLNLALQCAAVVCCRVSPKQKAQVVHLVRYKKRTLTLAIGDGANDVSMIKEAHIGVGIAGGMEGQQAVLASDYSIAQFRFLQRLLLVHGRLDFIRISKLIPYSYYKNVSFALTNYWYQFFAGFSGQKFAEDNYTNFWNILFTAFPIMALAVFDKDVRDHDLAFYFPTMYVHGQKSPDFNSRVFALWMLDAIAMSFILFFFPVFMLSSANEDGRVDGIWGASFASVAAVCVGVNLRILFESRTITWVHLVTVFGSIGVFWIFTLVYHQVSPELLQEVKGETAYYKLFYEVEAPDPVFWLCSALCLICVLAPGFAIKAWAQCFKPDRAVQLATTEVKWRRTFVRMCQQVDIAATYDDYRDFALFKINFEGHGEVETVDNATMTAKNATFTSPTEPTNNSISTEGLTPTFLAWLQHSNRSEALRKLGYTLESKTESEFMKDRVASELSRQSDRRRLRESSSCCVLDPTSNFAYAAGSNPQLRRSISLVPNSNTTTPRRLGPASARTMALDATIVESDVTMTPRVQL
eukprot:PhM_4_TR16204/c0_g1_i1/m.42219/K14802/DRS2, ATP8A; phospholipid-transporting ATPase